MVSPPCPRPLPLTATGVTRGFLSQLVFVPHDQGPGDVGAGHRGSQAEDRSPAAETAPLGGCAAQGVTDLVTITSEVIMRAVAHPSLSPGYGLFTSHSASLEIEGTYKVGAQLEL